MKGIISEEIEGWDSHRCERVEHNASEMKRLSPWVFFSIGAVVDFVFAWVRWRSVAAGIVSIICGVPLTAVLFFAINAAVKDGDNSGDPRN